MLPLILVAVGAYLIGDSLLEDKKYAKGGMSDGGEKAAKKRLEELRKELRAERISYGELAELESLKKYIDDDDVELRQAAGIPEFDDEDDDDDKYAKGGKVMTDKQTIAKLKKQFDKKYQGSDFDFDKDDNFKVDGYNVEVFDWKEEDEMNDYIKMNSKDNYLVPYSSDDDNYYLIVVPKDKMAKGGEVDEDYKYELNDYILEKFYTPKSKKINGFKLMDPEEGETPFIWKKGNIEIAAVPSTESDDDISLQVFKNSDEPISEQEFIPFPLTGDLEEDSNKYVEILKPYFENYASSKSIGKIVKKEKPIDTEAIKKYEEKQRIAKEIANIVDGYDWTIYKVSESYKLNFPMLLEEVKAKKIKKVDFDNLNKSTGTIAWKNDILSKFGNIMSKQEKERLQKHDGKSVYMAKGGKLVGKQKNLDVNKNGKLDAEDFKLLRGEKMAKGGQVKVGDKFYDKKFKQNLEVLKEMDDSGAYYVKWEDGKEIPYSTKNINFFIEKKIWVKK